MPPQSRGSHSSSKPPPSPQGLYSKSSPNLVTLNSFKKKDLNTHPTSNHDPQKHSPPTITSQVPLISPEFLRPSLSSLPARTLDGDLNDTDLTPPTNTNNPASNNPSRPIYNLHSRSHTYIGPSAFAPPFYNRPPTPLPPSPSLTSLLRPTFATTSRPNTPDPSSDDDPSSAALRSAADGSQTPNSAAASALGTTLRNNSKPIPRASPKVPTYEYYGFTLYLTSSLAFIVYVLWAFLPSPFLHQLGIYYYPNRWWALAIPAWTVMLIVYIYVALAAYNTCYLTLPLDSVESLVDAAASVAIVDSQGRIIRHERPSWGALQPPTPRPDTKRSLSKSAARKSAQANSSKQPKRAPAPAAPHLHPSSSYAAQPTPPLNWTQLWNEGTDAVMDIPIGGVCEILYGSRRDGDEDSDEVDDLG